MRDWLLIFAWVSLLLVVIVQQWTITRLTRRWTARLEKVQRELREQRGQV